jgi:hypothetical protein
LSIGESLRKGLSVKFREKLVFLREEANFHLSNRIDYAHISPFCLKSIYFPREKSVFVIRHKGVPITIARKSREFKSDTILNGLAELSIHQLEGFPAHQVIIEVETDLILALSLA